MQKGQYHHTNLTHMGNLKIHIHSGRGYNGGFQCLQSGTNGGDIHYRAHILV